MQNRIEQNIPLTTTTLQSSEVTGFGRALLSLTEEKLVKHPYNLHGGAAMAIEQLIKVLKTTESLLF